VKVLVTGCLSLFNSNNNNNNNNYCNNLNGKYFGLKMAQNCPNHLGIGNTEGVLQLDVRNSLWPTNWLTVSVSA